MAFTRYQTYLRQNDEGTLNLAGFVWPYVMIALSISCFIFVVKMYYKNKDHKFIFDLRNVDFLLPLLFTILYTATAVYDYATWYNTRALSFSGFFIVILSSMPYLIFFTDRFDRCKGRFAGGPGYDKKEEDLLEEKSEVLLKQKSELLEKEENEDKDLLEKKENEEKDLFDGCKNMPCCKKTIANWKIFCETIQTELDKIGWGRGKWVWVIFLTIMVCLAIFELQLTLITGKKYVKWDAAGRDNTTESYNSTILQPIKRIVGFQNVEFSFYLISQIICIAFTSMVMFTPSKGMTDFSKRDSGWVSGSGLDWSLALVSVVVSLLLMNGWIHEMKFRACIDESIEYDLTYYQMSQFTKNHIDLKGCYKYGFEMKTYDEFNTGNFIIQMCFDFLIMCVCCYRAFEVNKKREYDDKGNLKKPLLTEMQRNIAKGIVQNKSEPKKSTRPLLIKSMIVDPKDPKMDNKSGPAFKSPMKAYKESAFESPMRAYQE